MLLCQGHPRSRMRRFCWICVSMLRLTRSDLTSCNSASGHSSCSSGRIDDSASPQDPFANMTLGANDVGSEMSRACARYASSILATHLPVRRVTFIWTYHDREEVSTESKLELLRDFIIQDSATLLERFIDRVDTAAVGMTDIGLLRRKSPWLHGKTVSRHSHHLRLWTTTVL